MLSKEDNEILTRVGPGTMMGNLLRRYWTPALLSLEVPEPDSPPVRVRILGEDLVAYRDMLTTVRDRIAALVREGKTLEEVVAAKPTAEFDAQWGSPDHMLFLPVIYAELKGRN